MSRSPTERTIPQSQQMQITSGNRNAQQQPSITSSTQTSVNSNLTFSSNSAISNINTSVDNSNNLVRTQSVTNNSVKNKTNNLKSYVYSTSTTFLHATTSTSTETTIPLPALLTSNSLTSSTQQLNTAQSSLPRKKIKLESPATDKDDISAIKKRILELKYIQSKTIKDR